MYDAKTETFGNINISPQKSAFVESLKAEFSVSENGLAIVFDDNDYLNYPSEKWRGEGLHMNIEKGDMELEKELGIPYHIKNTIEGTSNNPLACHCEGA